MGRLLDREEIPEGEPVWCGADFGWKWDTTALVPLWMPDSSTRVIGDARDPHATARRHQPPRRRPEAFLASTSATRSTPSSWTRTPAAHQMAGWIESELGARVVSHSQGHSAMALAYERWMEARQKCARTHTPRGSRHAPAHASRDSGTPGTSSTPVADDYRVTRRPAARPLRPAVTERPSRDGPASSQPTTARLGRPHTPAA
jgi:hypothetical protein